LLSQLKQYRVNITALQETRWQAKDIMDMESYTLFQSGKKKGTREFGVAFVVDRSKKRNVLDFKAVDETTCILRIKTKFFKFYRCTCSYRGKGGSRKGSLLPQIG
jgi:uridine phosphorylase